MSKKYTYDIGNNRLLKIAKKYDQLCIEEKGSVKSATFTPFRWPSILLCLAFLIPFAVVFVCHLDMSNEYIFARSPTNSRGAIPPHSSLNLPKTLTFRGLYSSRSFG